LNGTFEILQTKKKLTKKNFEEEEILKKKNFKEEELLKEL